MRGHKKFRMWVKNDEIIKISMSPIDEIAVE
jgi:translation initiation factor IF-1